MQLSVESVFAPIADDLIADADSRATNRQLCSYIFAGAAVYGFAMGLRHSLLQATVSAGKVPALFFLTLLICLPSLHFVGLLFGSPVRFRQSIAVLLTGLASTSILLAAFTPIAVFFLVIGSRYAFLMLLHVAIFAFCGAAGLRIIGRTFRHIRATVAAPDAADSSRSVLRAWMLLYMFVGTQMAYTLGPFVGRESTFWWFHTDGGNFYTCVLSLIGDLLR